MVHPAHEDQGAFGDEAADEVLPCESFGVGVEVFFVLRAGFAFVGEESGAEGGEGGVD